MDHCSLVVLGDLLLLFLSPRVSLRFKLLTFRVLLLFVLVLALVDSSAAQLSHHVLPSSMPQPFTKSRSFCITFPSSFSCSSVTLCTSLFTRLTPHHFVLFSFSPACCHPHHPGHGHPAIQMHLCLLSHKRLVGDSFSIQSTPLFLVWSFKERTKINHCFCIRASVCKNSLIFQASSRALHFALQFDKLFFEWSYLHNVGLRRETTGM